ncbi:MAG TPA: class I SAM-dependent methyltransferase [Thermoanaerobaculia bacterium]|nr:class I SAM-dependent methyltransferase [Thermoanaerobaculia bacterium]
MNGSGEFFHQFADTFDTIYDGRRSRFMQAVDRTFRSDMFGRFNKTFEHLGDLKGKTVLDIGCGSGPYIVEALRRGAAKVIGLDPAPRMLEIAAARLDAGKMRDRAELLHGSFPSDAQTIPGRPDVAIVMGVMDYIDEPQSFLKALAQKVGTGAVLSFPSRHWFRTPLRQVRYKLRHCPVYFYDEARIRDLMQRAGFRTVTVTKLPGAGMDYVAWGAN